MKSPISYCKPDSRFRVRAGALTVALLLAAAPALAQVITIDTHGNAKQGPGSTVDRRFSQIEPTHVDLSQAPLDSRTRLELTRLLQAEQGFAMRPFPRGHKGLTLQANGKLSPAGESYLDMVTENGLSAKPGDRLVITDIKFDKNKIVFMLNGGPDAKHRFLRHLEIGPGVYTDTPVVQDDGQQPMGARLTLTFKDHVPSMTDKEVKALLAPLISFDVKTPIQAFTDTLPPQLKQAILTHHILVGMTTDMVFYALGRPDKKIRDQEGDIPYEEWIYGQPPDPVQFVRINGNRVIRFEIAAVGKPPQVWDKDVVDAMMRTDGTPVAPPPASTRTVAMGDVVRNPDTQAPAPPPSLRQPGEATKDDPQTLSGSGQMKPVQFPKQQADDYPDASKLPRTASADEDAADTQDQQKPAEKSATADKDKSKPADKPAPPNPPAQPGTPPAGQQK